MTIPRLPGTAGQCPASTVSNGLRASAYFEAFGFDLLHAADVLRDTHSELAFGGAVHHAAERDDAIERGHCDVEGVDTAREHQRGFHLRGDPRVRHRLLGLCVFRLELVQTFRLGADGDL